MGSRWDLSWGAGGMKKNELKGRAVQEKIKISERGWRGGTLEEITLLKWADIFNK